MDNETSGWIDAAEQADDNLHGIRCALIAIAHALQRLADHTEQERE
jgi:hypothetical protein